MLGDAAGTNTSSLNEPNFGTDILVIQLLGGSFYEGRN